MFELKISTKVDKYICDYYDRMFDNPIYSSDQSTFEHQVYGIQETFKKVIDDLSKNPLSYPSLNENIYFIVNTYLPFVLFYTIENLEIRIFDCYKREELF